MRRVREMSLSLRPAVLDDLGLLAALTWHLERYTAQTGVRIEFIESGSKGRRFAAPVETAAFRIVQEALTNIARHAGVDEATVTAPADDRNLTVEISDDGRGFDSLAVSETHNSTGIAGMMKRALLLGGQLRARSAPDAGTTITAELPIK
jgi:signal transduction histidine kinase